MEQTQTAAQEWFAIYNAPPTGDPTTWLAICDGVEAGDDARRIAAEEGVDLDDEAWARVALKAYREWLAKPTTPAAPADLADWREVRNSACPAGCKVYRADTGTEAVVHLPTYGCGSRLRVVPVSTTP